MNERLKSLVYQLGAEAQKAGMGNSDRRAYVLSELQTRGHLTAAEAQEAYDQTYAELRARKSAQQPASFDEQVAALEAEFKRRIAELRQQREKQKPERVYIVVVRDGEGWRVRRKNEPRVSVSHYDREADANAVADRIEQIVRLEVEAERLTAGKTAVN